MRINKKSWHYRLIVWSSRCVPKSLCPYFWTMNWCVVTALPRAFFRRILKSLDAASSRSDDRNAAVYREMSDLQAFRILLGRYSVDELATGNYSTYSLGTAVSAWWWKQDQLGRRPAQIIMELAESYEQGKIVFRSLSVKRAIMQVLVSYFSYWYWGAALICFTWGFTYLTELYWHLDNETYSITGCIAFGTMLSLLPTALVFVVPFVIGHDTRWRADLSRKYYVPREDDMVGAMIKATHRKACPILEFHS